MSAATARDAWALVQAYRHRHRCTIASLADAAGVSVSAIDSLRLGRAGARAIDRLTEFLRAHRDGHSALLPSDRPVDTAEGGAAGLAAAWQRSGVPARPCPLACARAAAEDARAADLRRRAA